MADNILRALISADGSQFTKTITQLEAQYKRFQEALKTATSVEGVARINRALDATKVRIEQLRNFGGLQALKGGLNSINPAANSANLSLTNLGRVVQDLPYGIIGVANNINPLVEGLGRLKEQAKATGTSVTSLLLKSLTGAGGLGLAISAITAAASFAVVGFSAFSRGMGGTSEASRKAAEDLKAFQDRMRDLTRDIGEIRAEAAGNVAGEIEKVRSLSAVVLNQTASYNERNNALRDLKEINKNYFGDLSLEADKLATLKGRVNEYTQALIASSIVKAFSEEIGKVGKELALAELAMNKTGKAIRALKTDASGAPRINPIDSRAIQISGELFNTFNKLTEQEGSQISTVLTLRDRYRELSGALQSAINTSLQFKPLTGGLPEKVKDDTSKIIAHAKRIQEALQDAFFIVDPQIIDLDDVQTQLSKAKQIIERFSRSGGDTTAFFKIQIPVEIQLPTPEQKTELQNELLRFGGTLVLRAKLQADDEEKKSFEDKLKEQNDRLTEIARTGATNIAAAIGDGIGSVLSGEGVKGLFGGIFNALGAGLKTLGTYLISISKLIKGIKLALNTLNPGAALGIGIALVALGTVIQKSIPKFASGGRPQFGQFNIVGERGPELFVPDVPGRIVSNHDLGSIGGGMNVQVTGELVGRGQNLVAVISHVNKSNGRNF